MIGPRTGAVAAVGFVVIGAVELALTGGPNPGAGEAEAAITYFTDEASSASAVAVLSAVAAPLLLVFTAGLARLLADRGLTALAWVGAGVTVALAFVGQVVQQAAWTVSTGVDEGVLATAGAMVAFAFGFALIGGSALALVTGVAAFRDGHLPRWLVVPAGLTALVSLVGLASPEVAAIAFPVFLLWLLSTAVALFRAPSEAATTA
ncbi:MAG: hypothetical protein R3343_06620 [Nitriliruptorales bacterium]|nr:hypothetical protein [Nitriliruptorales bacterium]